MAKKKRELYDCWSGIGALQMPTDDTDAEDGVDHSAVVKKFKAALKKLAVEFQKENPPYEVVFNGNGHFYLEDKTIIKG